jgi:hypothetical protein
MSDREKREPIPIDAYDGDWIKKRDRARVRCQGVLALLEVAPCVSSALDRERENGEDRQADSDASEAVERRSWNDQVAERPRAEDEHDVGSEPLVLPRGQAWHASLRPTAAPRTYPGAAAQYEPGDLIVVSLEDPDRPGHPGRYKARVIEQLGAEHHHGGDEKEEE